ncbi:Gfo/Idh/MocA family protein [Bryobacter aggregatus]|uniref:Gfo/Idh/MocA family protein n=1 Tax=Bryobacter aggregatus TaxID=360054 RepID=UPI0004E19390|nr:Gfo/Idh/MocA family oxidoreductase [Bryobacter aggregatus]
MSTRREFLEVSALGGATASLAQAQKISANDKIRVGCIGMGNMGLGDVKTASTVDGVEFVAVADVYEGRLTNAKEMFGKQIFTTRDYRELLARPDIDAVIIATPDHWHATQAVAALEAGKHVYCQKPMVKNPEDGHKIIAAEKKSGKVFQVGSQRVSSILYARLREVIKEGKIGEIRMIEAFYDRNSALGAWQYVIPYDASPSTVSWDSFIGSAPKRPFEPIRLFRWRNYQDYGTGIAGDLFVHLFSGIHYVMDSNGPERVFASGGTYYWNDGRDVPDLMIGLYDYPKTATHGAHQITLRVNFEAGTGGGQSFRFVGTEGYITLDVGNGFTVHSTPREARPGYDLQPFPAAVKKQFLDEYKKQYPDQKPSADSMRPATSYSYKLPAGYAEQFAHHANFYDAIRNKRAVIEDATFGLRAAAPALLSNTSYFEKRLVQWDPTAMKIKA